MKKIKALFSGKSQTVQAAPKSEDDYYRELFIENPQWNKPAPNAEELQRWNIIEKFVYFIRGFQRSSTDQAQIKILDLGCGRGWLSNLLSSYGEITAVEPVAEVAAYAKKMFPALNISAGGADNLLENGLKENFQLLVCSEVIEHVPDHEKGSFVSKIENLISKGGFAIITTPRKETQAEWMKHSNPDQPVEEWVDETTLINLFTTNGFSVVDMQRCAAKPTPQGPDIEIYQLWLFQKK